jgi:cephalosporin hydroxylase
MKSFRKQVMGLAQRAYLEFYTNTLVSRLITNQFTRLYYHAPVPARVWHTTRWLGVSLLKSPLDLWNYQEIIYEQRPDTIIESGTGEGGSALFFASLFDLLGSGTVISVDIVKDNHRPRHRRIKYLLGSSTAPEVVAQVEKELRKSRRVMVVLDSGHEMHHVLKELEIYHRYVSLGGYVIVEDTCINGHPVSPQYGPGPMEAVETFLRNNDQFVSDDRDRKFFMTMNPRGYLRRVK